MSCGNAGAGGSGGGGGLVEAKSVEVQGGEIIDLSETPLKYGQKDSNVPDAVRAVVEAQEKKRLSAKVEYGMVFDEDGNPKGPERRGGKGGVSTPISWETPGSTFTHNHPRSGDQSGMLGGSFSDADIRSFNIGNARTYRASAGEGTYSISKKPGYNGDGLLSHIRSEDKRLREEYSRTVRDAAKKARAGEMSYKDAQAAQKKAFNKYMVQYHNVFLEGQQRFGYSYTLERRD